MPLFSKKSQTVRLELWLFVLFLGFIFFTGGSSRADTQSFVFLRPIAAIALGFAVYKLPLTVCKSHRIILSIALASIALIILHLIPLPASIWSYLPQAETYSKVGDLTGTAGSYRPIAMVPPSALNALYSTIVPMAVLLWCLRFSAADWRFVIAAILILGIFNILMGLVQILGPTKGPLYLYRITNYGHPVGLFANRNHFAVFLACLFPIFTIYATTQITSREQAIRKRWLSMLGAAMVLPMILLSGSRAGLFAGLVGLVTIPLLWKYEKELPAAKRKIRAGSISFFHKHFEVILAISALATIVAAALYYARAVAIDRLLSEAEGQVTRQEMWKLSWQISGDYMPLGSGVGSFVEVYQMYEPDSSLSPNYVNHAHNDWLESLMTGGIPAGVIIVFAVSAWLLAAFQYWKVRDKRDFDTKLALAGIVVTAILACASFFDYPLRVPSLICLFACAAVWISRRFGKVRAEEK